MAGRACASASLRRWRVGFLEREARRDAGDLAAGFRDHLLLLRHNESWKAFARRGKAAAAVVAAAAAMGRRARMRRAFRGLARAAEIAAFEKEDALPVLKEKFGAWAVFVGDRARKRNALVEEGRGAER